MPAEGVVAVKTYIVHAKRWERGWELHIDGVGVTQSHGLTDSPDMARSYITMMTGRAAGTFEVNLIPHLGGGLDEAVGRARDAVRQAEEAQRRAGAKSRSIARRLREQGLSGRDIAAVLRVTPQRVSQLLATDQPKERTEASS
jgi:hypothetical protein